MCSQKGYCVVKKLVWNVRIKAFWYTNTIKVHYFVYNSINLQSRKTEGTVDFSYFLEKRILNLVAQNHKKIRCIQWFYLEKQY